MLLSGEDAVTYLQDWLSRYPHIRADSALLAAIQLGLEEQGWVRLSTTDEDAVARQNFLIMALLIDGRAAVRDRATGTLASEARVVFWGSCEMANGKGVLLPDSTELLRTLDGWHSCSSD